jgi:type II secretory pathway pseudopilin PulG
MSLDDLRFRKLQERGDTIVEVLISIAVVSLVLGGAYVTTNTSLRSTRAAQEQGDALKLVEGQLEQIKGYLNDGTRSVTSMPTSDFCMKNGTTASPLSQCKINADGSTASAAAQPAYQLNINRSGNTFRISNDWTTAAGKKGGMQMTYRVY